LVVLILRSKGKFCHAKSDIRNCLILSFSCPSSDRPGTASSWDGRASTQKAGCDHGL
jgi:hypothetical protein